MQITLKTDTSNLIDIGTVKRKIQQKPAVFNIDPEKAELYIGFPENSRIAGGYIKQIASTMRIIFLNSGQVLRFTDADEDIIRSNITVLNHMVCAFSPENYRSRTAIEHDLNTLFDKYRSGRKIYNYINNSVPWLLLLNQIGIPLIQLRTEFTLIDMYGRLYTDSKENNRVFNAFFRHHYEDEETGNILDDFYRTQIYSRLNENNVHNLKAHSFNSIQKVIDYVSSREDIYPSKIDKFAGVVYKLRCRYFHGNMTATYPVDTSGCDFISELENLLYTLLMRSVEELFSEVENT